MPSGPAGQVRRPPSGVSAVSPCTDDSPFFFQYYKWSRLLGFQAGEGGYGFMRVPMGLMVLLFTAGQVTLAGFLLMPYFLPDAGWLLRWGVLLWYITVGAFIGVFGVVTYHPVLKLPMPWWFLSTLVGAWMNFVLTFFAYDAMADMIAAQRSYQLNLQVIRTNEETYQAALRIGR